MDLILPGNCKKKKKKLLLVASSGRAAPGREDGLDGRDEEEGRWMALIIMAM